MNLHMDILYNTFIPGWVVPRTKAWDGGEFNPVIGLAFERIDELKSPVVLLRNREDYRLGVVTPVSGIHF